ncbi:MAG: glycosyltransferase family 2 protein [Nanoarchaeota archaeon]|nr:glycosyltransferase family 2 protein [Nanoarchaeota archaeon]
MILSVIIPVYNEQGNIEYLYDELRDTLKSIKTYEVIFVDDGSEDRTYEVLERIAKKDKKIRVIKHRSNYGKGVALQSGLDICKGENIIVMDGDGQHDPKYIHDYLEKLKSHDVVTSVRSGRGGIGPGIVTPIGNFLIRSLFKTDLKDGVGSKIGFTRQVKDNIFVYGNLFRYIPLLALWKGFKVTEHEIVIRPRRSGQSKFNIFKPFKGFIDLLTMKFFVSYSTRPSHIFGSAGLISLGIGGLALAYLFLKKLFIGTAITESLPMFLLGILLVLIGFNFLFFGFLGDMLSHDKLERRRNESYRIERVI